MTIYLIRHGKTLANQQHLYCGSTDLPLSAEGKEELDKLHYNLPDLRYLTSGMKRANETLTRLFGDVPFETDPRFREVDFGIFEMRSYEMLKDLPAYQTWITGNNEDNVPPGGESGSAMVQRAFEAFCEIQEDTCVITHGGVIAAIMARLFPEEHKNRYQWQPDNGCGYCITDGSYQEIPTIRT